MLSEKRSALYGAAKLYAAEPNDETGRALCMAASAYAEARLLAVSGATAAARQQQRREAVVPFGRSKGKPLSAVTRSELEWLLGAVEASLADPTKERFRTANEGLRDTVRAELSRRRP